MYDDQAAFLRAILENPCDDTIKLVYADWLEERATTPGELVDVRRMRANAGYLTGGASRFMPKSWQLLWGELECVTQVRWQVESSGYLPCYAARCGFVSAVAGT